MKIGIISSICNGHSGARAPIDLALTLAKHHQIYFYAFEVDKEPAVIKLMRSRGIKIVLLPKSPWPILGSLVDGYRLYRLLAGSPIEVLSSHSILSLTMAARLSGKPMVGCYYGSQFDVLKERKQLLNSFWRLINWLINGLIWAKAWCLVQLPNRLVAISDYCTDEAKRLYGRSAKTIYLGAVSELLTNSTVAKMVKKKPIMLSVSRITPYKQFELVIEAKKKADPEQQWQLVIIGSAPRAHYLQFLRSISDQSTTILVNASDQELAWYYRHADLYVSADRYLFFGMPVMEAAWYGKPSVVMDYAAAEELIDDSQTGYLARSKQQFYKYLQRLLADPKLRSELGRAARAKAIEFSWERCAKEWEKSMMEVADDKIKQVL